MQFTKPMIDLVYEIRRRVKSDLKPEVKLANPELLPVLVKTFREDKNDTITQTLIKELMSLAGSPWSGALSEESAGAQFPRLVSKAYRGAFSHQAAPEAKPKREEGERARPVKIYRGRVVND